MYAVFDFETTGVYNKDRIIEVAIAHVDPDGAVTDRWETLVNPRRDLGKQALHGIRSADVLKAPSFDAIAGEVLERFRGRIPVAHNLPFDARMLVQECLRMGLDVPDLAEYGVCTMSWSGRFLPESGRSLAECCRAANIRNDRPHEAMSDVLATAELLGAFLAASGSRPPWADLGALVARLHWPELPIGGVPPVRRGEHAVVGPDFLSRLVTHLPRVPDPPQADMYLSVLDRALVDRRVSATEADELAAVAAALGITRTTALQLHRDYLRALAVAALEDGVVTESEHSDLAHVAALLGLDAGAVDEALDTVDTGDAPEPQVSPFRLKPADIVVLTGTFPEAKEYWAYRLEAAGLRVAANVTKKTTLVVAADPDSMSGKAERARRYGIPVIGAESVDLVLARLLREG
jgi:DNA polymerase-3 subunit epsilon